MVASKGGINFDTAMEMHDSERVVWLIALGEAQGLKFDWDLFRFKEIEMPQLPTRRGR